MISKIYLVIEKYSNLITNNTAKHIVHGDFDPANILVDKINGSWIITGILDWEFAFSGLYLWDIANMLRYAHKMPPEFQKSFIDSLKKNGIKFHRSWRKTVHLMNLLSLLDCLKRSDPKKQPNRCTDILELITHTLAKLNKTKLKQPPKKS
jgi:thiamine kinase-like enzyme